MKRKTLAMFLAGALSLSLLAGCGNKVGSSTLPGTTTIKRGH